MNFLKLQIKNFMKLNLKKILSLSYFYIFVFILFLEMVLNSAGELYHFEKTTINIFYYSFFLGGNTK